MFRVPNNSNAPTKNNPDKIDSSPLSSSVHLVPWTGSVKAHARKQKTHPTAVGRKGRGTFWSTPQHHRGHDPEPAAARKPRETPHGTAYLPCLAPNHPPRAPRPPPRSSQLHNRGDPFPHRLVLTQKHFSSSVTVPIHPRLLVCFA
jgi:hypothetical protein